MAKGVFHTLTTLTLVTALVGCQPEGSETNSTDKP